MQEAWCLPSHLLCSLEMWNQRLCFFYYSSDLREKVVVSYQLLNYLNSKAVMWGKSSPYEHQEEDSALCRVWFELCLISCSRLGHMGHLRLESQSCTLCRSRLLNGCRESWLTLLIQCERTTHAQKKKVFHPFTELTCAVATQLQDPTQRRVGNKECGKAGLLLP